MEAMIPFLALAAAGIPVAVAGAGFYSRTREHPVTQRRTITTGQFAALTATAYVLLSLGTLAILAGSAGVLALELGLVP